MKFSPMGNLKYLRLKSGPSIKISPGHKILFFYISGSKCHRNMILVSKYMFLGSTNWMA